MTGRCSCSTSVRGRTGSPPEWLAAVTAALEEVESSAAPRALVTTALGKSYSQGLDLARLEHADQRETYLASVHALLAAFLTSSAPTVAAVQGHAFGAGGMLLLCHDLAVMREDRGYFCLPEIDLRLPFTDGMNALVTARLPSPTAHEAMVTGRRYGGRAAEQAGIVAVAVPEDEVLPQAVHRAAALAGKDPATLRAIKATLYEHVLAHLLHDDR